LTHPDRYGLGAEAERIDGKDAYSQMSIEKSLDNPSKITYKDRVLLSFSPEGLGGE
jgi:hypothetical protein